MDSARRTIETTPILISFINRMSYEGHNTSPPSCSCGKGIMLLLCASEKSNNPGRYFYKCPVDGKHSKSFIWCDDFHRQNNNFTGTSNTIDGGVECSKVRSKVPTRSEHNGQSMNNSAKGAGMGSLTNTLCFLVILNRILIFTSFCLVMIGFVAGKHY